MNYEELSLKCPSVFFLSGGESGLEDFSDKPFDSVVKYNMRKSLDLEQEGCYLQAGKKECLVECGFNATAKTIFIIHGWTVNMITQGHGFQTESFPVTLNRMYLHFSQCSERTVL